MVYGRDNQLLVSLTNGLNEAVTVFTVSGTLTKLSKEGKPKGQAFQLPPQRILQPAPANDSYKIAWVLKPELEPSNYHLEAYVEVISPVI